jgi:hypothetical protein
MFQFLSVLVCLIGILMFMAAAVAPASLKAAATNVELVLDVGGGAHHKKPLFLECRQSRAQTFDGKMSFTEAEEKTGLKDNTPASTPFTKFLEELAGKQGQEYVLFVVRPDGIQTFRVLKRILEKRNRTRCTTTVAMAENPNPLAEKKLPRGLAARYAYAGGKLSFLKKMSPEEYEALRTLFSQVASQKAVAELYAKSRQAGAWVDYGSELIPDQWNWKVR